MHNVCFILAYFFFFGAALAGAAFLGAVEAFFGACFTAVLAGAAFFGAAFAAFVVTFFFGVALTAAALIGVFLALVLFICAADFNDTFGAFALVGATASLKKVPQELLFCVSE
jgi:hypothetical protein